MRTRIILSTVAFAVLLSGCGGTASEPDDGRLDVVAGFYPLAFSAERVGGEAVDVRNLTPLGAEPHDLELAPRDVETIVGADVVLYLGGGFQPGLEDALEGASGIVVDLLEGVGQGAREAEADGTDTGLDPHVWLDPVLYADIVERIGDVLGRPAPAAALADELRALDQEFVAGLSGCEQRPLVTSHAAFGYLAARYGLEQIGVSGLSPEAEPSPRDLERVVELVRASGAGTIFFETLVSPELAETVARETGARTAVLNPLEGLTPEEADEGDDYFSIMRANLAALREGLGCR